MKSNYIAQGWLVVVLSLSFGAALAGVETWLRPLIEANKLAATIRQIPALVQGADSAASAKVKPLVVSVGEGAARARYEAFRALTGEGKQVGWVIKAGGKGFAGKIELLIGLDAPAERITGLHILEQVETPGLGDKIHEGDAQNKGFLWAFYNHHPDASRPLEVVKSAPDPGKPNAIQAVTGATISSRSVCNIVNDALSKPLRGALRAASAAAGNEPSARGGKE